MYFCFGQKSFPYPFLVSSMMGECIISRSIYRSSVISIFHWDTIVDLVMLVMADFDVILRVDYAENLNI